jgi:hypothetical protein
MLGMRMQRVRRFAEYPPFRTTTVIHRRIKHADDIESAATMRVH